MVLFLFLFAFCFTLSTLGDVTYYRHDSYTNQYGYFSDSERLEMLTATKSMFHFGYDNYMKYAFPDDELNPVNCSGRGHDHRNPYNININDVLGDYCLTLIDVLDTLAVMGNTTEFKNAVSLLIEHLSFEKNTTVQVFEANIRVLGGLLSAHMIITDPQQPFGDLVPPGYDNDLLDLAHDLASRLLPAFDNTPTMIPFPRVNLKKGIPKNSWNTTCTAGAGSLMLEMGVLSRLLRDPVYEGSARRAIQGLWKHRDKTTGLLGNVINMMTGEWTGKLSGIGAGHDSFYEYLLKSYILFGDVSDLMMFKKAYRSVKEFMRKGRTKCNEGEGDHPLYVNVHMTSGQTATTWIDSLQAAFPGVMILNGDIEEAICAHALYYSIWKRYGVLPERYNWRMKIPEVRFYPLRPELVESTYLLYQATKNPFYLHVGREILLNLEKYTKTKCGYATIHDVDDMSLEDRMESFFLSETCKYLYLLFDVDNHVNKHALNYIFTTEGHLFPVQREFRKMPWQGEMKSQYSKEEVLTVIDGVTDAKIVNNSENNCDEVPLERRFFIPLESHYWDILENSVGL